MAVLLNRYINNKGYTLPETANPKFIDDDQIAARASDALYEMQRVGLINGMPNGSLEKEILIIYIR